MRHLPFLRRLNIAVVALLCTLSVCASASSLTTVSPRIKSIADTWGCNVNGQCIEELSVYIREDGSRYMFFFAPTPTGFIHGGGTIPASDYVVSRTGVALNTDTSTNPNFTGEECDFAGNCTSFSGGVISLTWTLNGNFVSTIKGEMVNRTPGTTTKEVGTLSTSSATVAGTFLGIQFAPGELDSGTVTAAKGASISVTY